MPSEKLNQLLNELKGYLQELYGSRLTKVVLFGSQARGDAEPYSDIDIALILSGQVEPTQETSKIADITAPLSLKNDVVISCFCLSQERYEAENTPFLRNIRREGVIL